MKQFFLSVILALTSFAMSAQDAIRVRYSGAKPTITDFARAYCHYMDTLQETGDRPSNAIKHALECRDKGLPLDEGETFVVNERAGYIAYHAQHDRCFIEMEMCYWNEKDGKHKLFAFNNMASLCDGKPLLTETSGIDFLRYDNATRTMTFCDDPGVEVHYDNAVYSLPCDGKDITVTVFDEDGEVTEHILKWNGRRFLP